MSIPVTREIVSPKTEDKIRDRVRKVTEFQRPDGNARIVTEGDLNAMYEFFALPDVSDPIYTVEKPVTRESVQRHIRRKAKAQAKGEGFMLASFDEAGSVSGYFDFTIWPNWSAAEFGGATHPDQQSSGRGRDGIFRSIDFVFETLGVHRLCFTAAHDNIRSIKLIDAMGMTRMGEVTSKGPNGQTRQSLVWEMTADDWKHIRMLM